MNDQRQVIFSQRLKILKEDNISEIQKDFEEVVKDLLISANNYKKSNDEKYITEIKNVTGNSITDKELLNLASNNGDIFQKNGRIIFK